MAKKQEVIEEVAEIKEAPVDTELTFVLTLSQANIVLAALDEIPHKLSRGIIDSLQQQAMPQLQQPQ